VIWLGVLIGFNLGMIVGAFVWTGLAIRRMQDEQAEMQARARRYHG